MKKYIWMTAILVGGINLCSAQEAVKTETTGSEAGGDLIQVASPWNITIGLVYKNWLYEHDALQTRAPATSDRANDYEDGDTDGNGWGIKAKIGRGDGSLNVSFIKSDFTYELTKGSGRHQIDTISRDLEMSWSQIRDRNEQAEWGSILGFRYLGMQKDVMVSEKTMSVEGGGNMNWLMLLGGYEGNWRPFENPTFQMHGSILFFLGEVDGTARSGSDTDWNDGVVSESYGTEYSMAYGARASFGVDIAITKHVRMTVDYMREWLYSFDATDTGTVVFPDNSDALFMENQHAVTASLNYTF